MDSLASLALATEPPSTELLKRPPHSRKDYMVTKVIKLLLENGETYLRISHLLNNYLMYFSF